MENIEIFQIFTGVFLAGLLIYAAVKMARQDYSRPEKH